MLEWYYNSSHLPYAIYYHESLYDIKWLQKSSYTQFSNMQYCAYPTIATNGYSYG